MEGLGEEEAGSELLSLHPEAPAPSEERSGYRGHDLLIRVVAVAAIAWGCVYLIWRLIDSREGAQPELFALLYVCEIFGWLMLSSFTFLAWRIPLPVRPPLGRRPSVDIYVCTYNEDLDILTATLVGCPGSPTPHDLGARRRPSRRGAGAGRARGALPDPQQQRARQGATSTTPWSPRGRTLVVSTPTTFLNRTSSTYGGLLRRSGRRLVQTPHDFEHLDSFQHFSNGRHDQSIFFEVIMPGRTVTTACSGVDPASSAGRPRGPRRSRNRDHCRRLPHDDQDAPRRMENALSRRDARPGARAHDLAGFLLQRDRWARGNLAVLRTKENPLTVKGLTIKQRTSYLASLAAYFVPMQRLGMLTVLVVMLVTGLLPVHAPLWQFAVFWLPWMLLDLGASTFLARGEANLYDDAYVHSLTTEIYVRAALSIIRPIKTAFKVTPKNGVEGVVGRRSDNSGSSWRSKSWSLPRSLPASSRSPVSSTSITSVEWHILASIFFAVWELSLMGSALWRVTHRHQVRRNYRVGWKSPACSTAVWSGCRTDRKRRGHRRTSSDRARVRRPAPAQRSERRRRRRAHPGRLPCQVVLEARRKWVAGWEAAIDPMTERDNELLVEHCHVVSTRRRLIAAGRLLGRKDVTPVSDASRSEDPPLASHG